MTQYLLTVNHDETFDPAGLAPGEMAAIQAGVEAFNQKLQDEGRWVFAGGLAGPEVSTTLRPKDGEVLVTDGPFVETKEFIGGFWIIEAPDFDVALELAKEGALACRAVVELRPFQDGPPEID